MRRRLGSRDRSTIRNPEKFEFAGSSRAPLTAEPGERCAVGIGSNGLRPGDGCGPPICRGGPLCSRRWHSEGASLPLTDSSLAPFLLSVVHTVSRGRRVWMAEVPTYPAAIILDH